MARARNLGAAALAALGLVACGPSPQDVARLLEQQQQVLERLAKLEEGMDKLLAGAPAARQRPTEDFDKVHAIELGDSPLLGPAAAPVTIVEFSDFQCPFCAGAAPLVKEVQQKYGDKVKVVYKHFPLNFHPAARPAAIASIAAQEQGRFWEFHDVLFANTRELAEARLADYARQAGLDVERFKRDLEAKKAAYAARIDREYQEGLKADVRGTPTLYINGRKVRERSVEGMSAQIDQELARAGAS